MHSAFDTRTQQDDTKLITTVAKYKVRASNACAKNPANLNQHVVRDWVAICIVDFLEIVYINHQQRECCKETLRPGCFAVQGFIEESSVVEAGQRICCCQARI